MKKLAIAFTFPTFPAFAHDTGAAHLHGGDWAAFAVAGLVAFVMASRAVLVRVRAK